MLILLARVLASLLAPIAKSVIVAAVIGILATTAGYDVMGMLQTALMDWFWRLAG